MKKLSILLVFLMIVTLVVGCSIKTSDGKVKLTDKGVQFEDSKGNKSSVNSKNGNIEFNGTNGNVSAGQNVALPEGYPKELVPLDKEDNITYSAHTNANDFVVMYSTKESKESVKKFYDKVLEKAENKSNMDLGTSYMLAGTLDKYQVSLSIISNSSDTNEINVMITLSDKK